MSYTERWKERKIKQRITKIVNIFWLKSLSLSLSWKIVLFSSIILFISLFMPWVINNENNMSRNSFNTISWNIWYPLIIMISILFFSVLSLFNKDKIKLHSNLSFKNYFLIILIWFFIITSCIISINFINWFKTFVDKIKYWNWLITSLTAWFFIIFWWILMKKEHEKSEIWIFNNNTDTSYNEIEENNNNNNTKLPF